MKLIYIIAFFAFVNISTQSLYSQHTFEFNQIYNSNVVNNNSYGFSSGYVKNEQLYLFGVQAQVTINLSTRKEEKNELLQQINTFSEKKDDFIYKLSNNLTGSITVEKSVDNGKIWDISIFSTTQVAIGVQSFFVNNDTIIVVGATTNRFPIIYVTHDGFKETFAEIVLDIPNAPAFDIEFVNESFIVTVGEFLYISSDYGLNWQQVIHPQLPRNDFKRTIKFRNNEGYLFTEVNNSTKVFFSNDEGFNWEDLNSNLDENFRINDLYFLDENSLLVVGGNRVTQTGLALYSSDKGITWQTVNNFGDIPLRKIIPINSNKLLLISAFLSVWEVDIFPLSVSHSNPLPNLSIFPNPVNDVLYLGESDIQFDIVEIFDMKGTLLHTFDSKANSIDVSSYISGTYFIKYKKADIEVAQSKFIKQ